MEQLEFNFRKDTFNKIFPFYILLDANLGIKNYGKSIPKIIPEIKKTLFTDNFSIIRPQIEEYSPDEFKNLINQLVVIKSNYIDETIFRGQFEIMDEGYLFLGSPWFVTIEEVVQKNLSINDFAFHDSLLDILHATKNQEINYNDLKKLLKTVDEQRNILKKDKEKLVLLSSIAEKNFSAIVICNNKGVIEWVNDRFVELTEYAREEVYGKKTAKILQGPKTNIETLEFIDNQMLNSAAFNTEIVNYKKSKTPYWSRIKGRAITNHEGEVLKYFIIQEDITFEKEYRQNLTESENRLYTLIKNLQSGILLEDANRKIRIVNKKFCEIFGIAIDPDLMKGFDCNEAAESTKLLFKNPDQFLDRVTTIFKNQKMVVAEEVEMADGRILERSYIPILTDGSHLWNYVDITIKKRYEQSLEKEKIKYSNIINNMNMGLLEVDNDDIIQLANQSFCTMSGYGKSELLGKNAATIFLNEKNKKIIKNKLVDRTIKSITDSYEIDIKNKSKEVRHWMISGAPNFNLNGEVIGSIGIHLDITEKKKLEIQKEELLLKLEKQNESLNDYAHMVSHDLKSPLRSIHTLISWIKEEKDMLFTENGNKYMDMIVEKVEKMDYLIDGVLAISKLDSTEYKYQEVDLNEILTIIMAIIHIPTHVTIEISTQFPTIYTDKYRIQQLFQNLISNAVNYSNKKEGKVTITYNDIDDFHLFSIKDNGIGIDPSYHEKIFDIFESYSDDAKSSGIGLSIVKKIIENYKGEIWLESELNKGSIFYFKIPKGNDGTA